MNADKVNTWLSLSANVGVIFGLIFLAVELDQNSTLMRIQISQSRADAAMTNNESNYNSDYMPQINVKVKAGEELTTEETLRYSSYFRAINRNQDNVLQQYYAGMLSSNSPRSIRNYVEDNIASSKHARETWELQKVSYSDEYITLVEEVLGATEIQ
jgi:hypothetical protein